MTSRVKNVLDLVQYILILCNSIDLLCHTFCHFRYEAALSSLEESLHETNIKSTSLKKKTYNILYQIL